jgi:hypothetical protein
MAETNLYGSREVETVDMDVGRLYYGTDSTSIHGGELAYSVPQQAYP